MGAIAEQADGQAVMVGIAPGTAGIAQAAFAHWAVARHYTFHAARLLLLTRVDVETAIHVAVTRPTN
jgi:hypothetical protein